MQHALGATVIYITHDQQEALVLSDRVALLRNGRVEQYGSPQDLYKAPASLFAARFLGESNLVHGQWETGPRAGLRVNPSGLLLRLNPARSLTASDGQSVAAVLRPEMLAIGLTGGATAAAVEGVVTEAVFVRQTTRYVVDVPAFASPLIVLQVARAGDTAIGP